MRFETFDEVKDAVRDMLIEMMSQREIQTPVSFDTPIREIIDPEDLIMEAQETFNTELDVRGDEIPTTFEQFESFLLSTFFPSVSTAS